ncbi:MAG: site-2 protease family protein [Phycisphaerae bacterium]|nr:site-2 protease family protein [Tepidisphaeraceae bacterium]
MIESAFNFLLLIIGFGFVIFWHELGHFLAAKKVGIRVEQFAVGMGHAIMSYRRGIGFKFGNTRQEYERRAKSYLDKHNPSKDATYTEEQIAVAGDALGLGETEYRLSWIPIGGYVKMLGQDDMDPNRKADDPRAYNKKSVGARMLVISAGVIMNLILAGILFMILFLWGFRAPAPVVGQVLPNSPAQRAGVLPGDELISYNGHQVHDFTKLVLNTALSAPGEPVELVIRRDGVEHKLQITPDKRTPDTKTFISVGISGSPNLIGPKLALDPTDPALEPPGVRDIAPGDTIVEVNGKPVRAGDPKAGTAGDFAVLHAALQDATPENPVKLTVKDAAGATRTVVVQPHLGEEGFYLNDTFDIAGMQPRMAISFIASEKSPLFEHRKRITAGDAIQELLVYPTPDSQPNPVSNPSIDKFKKTLTEAGEKDQFVSVKFVKPDGKVETLDKVKPVSIKGGGYGLNFRPTFDELSTVVAEVEPGSVAAKAGIPAGSRLTTVNGKPVKNWFDVRAALLAAGQGDVAIGLINLATGATETKTLPLDKDAFARVQNLRNTANVVPYLGELIRVRQTGNPAEALAWGAAETRDLILQFYVTLRRMISRDVSPSNLMGPLGIFKAGHSFANRGGDWLIWFLAMISANLAVVNFLPIPIVDGGHFIFLLIEKIIGRPPSRKVLETAQLVGLLFIGFVFLYVTFNDISRFMQ